MGDRAKKPRVQLRDVEADDLPLFFEHQRDPVAVALVAFNSRDRAAFDQHWAKLLADDSCLKKTIVVASGASPDSVVASAVSADPSMTQVVAGNIGSWTSNAKREIGYWIDRAFWGRGIATEALSAFLRLEQTRPLHAGVAKHNAASIRVLQKCGFTLLGPEDVSPDEAEASHVLLRLDA
jgi:RimJ/RimL family protein N-acetyltransferase